MAAIGSHIVFYKMVPTAHNRRGQQQTMQAVLMCKRTHDAPTYPGHWSLLGGRVDDGESAEQALRREIEEELTVDANAIRLEKLCSTKVARGTGYIEIEYYKAALDMDMDTLTLKRHPHDGIVEGDGLAWFTEEETNHLWLRPEDRLALNTFFRRVRDTD